MVAKSSGGSSGGSSSIGGGGGSGVIIGGALNFGGGGANMFSGGAAGLAASYAQAYNSALETNQASYDNIINGYNQLAGQQLNNQNAITQGYNTLTSQVMGGLEGSANAQRQLIDRQYTQQAGQASQQLTNSGLNNSTVVQSLQRGITFDQQLAQTNLANQFAQLQAQYQTQLGLSGLGYQDQANQQQMQLGVQQLNWMNSVEAPYPDAGAYSALAQYYGQIDQANQDRDLMSSLYGKMQGANQQTGGGGFAGVYGKTGSYGGAMPSYGSSGSGYGIPMGTSPGLGAVNQGSSYGTPGSYSYAAPQNSNSGLLAAVGGGGYNSTYGNVYNEYAQAGDYGY